MLGRGVTVLDPHGDLINEVVKNVPDNRLTDVVLVDPSDSDYPIGLNLLTASSDAEKVILSSDLVSLFRRFATSWGDQMTSVLSNAINAVLESEDGGTLLDLRRFLVETRFRNEFLKSVQDPSVIYYWKNEFPLLRKNTVAPILTRLDTFLRPRIVRNMMAQKEGLDFKDILNSQKILLVKLAQGLIGEENGYLLGTLVVAKLHQAAQARQNLTKEQRKPFYFYIDEFQNFITPSMAAILSGARKYGLGLILAHQDLDQLARRDAELSNSVLSNPNIRVCFRCGDKDSAKLEDSFSYFDSTDLQSLNIGQSIVRVGRKDHDFNLTFELLPNVTAEVVKTRRKAIVKHSRKTYAIQRAQVEQLVEDALQVPIVPTPRKEATAKETETPTERTEAVVSIEKNVTKETNRDLKSEASKFIAKEVNKEAQPEHRFLQEFVKKIAEERNLKAVIEDPVNNGTGKVDVALHHNDLQIACEISVTNTPKYEVSNIQKCLRAGFHLVFMISNDARHLHSIRELAISNTNEEAHPRLHFVSKEGFVQQLDLILSQLLKTTETRTRGYRVKVKYKPSPDSAGQNEAIKSAILSSLRRSDRSK